MTAWYREMMDELVPRKASFWPKQFSELYRFCCHTAAAEDLTQKIHTASADAEIASRLYLEFRSHGALFT